MVSDIPNQEQILLAELGHVEVIISLSCLRNTSESSRRWLETTAPMTQTLISSREYR